jgi:sugar lactone lactonase YvrE
MLPIPSSVGCSGGLRFYAVDKATVRIIDAGTGAQQILSGHTGVCGFVDGTSDVSRFFWPNGLALSADEKALYVCDQFNHRVRMVDTTSGDTCTVAGAGVRANEDGIGREALIWSPRCCDWDRASDIEPFTSLYIAASHKLRRLNLKTGQMTSINCDDTIRPAGMICLSGSGLIIITCFNARRLWTLDPRTNAMERLAGALGLTGPTKSAQTEWEDPLSIYFERLSGIAWHKRDQSLLVVDSDLHTVFRVPLPDRLFPDPNAQSTTRN